MNNYLIVSNDKITLEDLIAKLNKNNDSEIVYYDLLEDSIDKVINDLNTYNLFTSKKIIIGTNTYFLGSEKVKSNIEHNIDNLVNYLNNPSDNYLILITSSIDKRKKIVSDILEKVNLIEELTDINSIIKKRLDTYKMDNKTLDYLLAKCSNDHERILNEIEKLKLYKIDNKEITIGDIDMIVMDNYDDNIFHFVDSILNGNKKHAFKLYNAFILHGEQIPYMIALLSNKIRLFYQVSVLSSEGLNYKDIAKKLKVHEYPVKLAYEQIYRYDKKKLLSLLDKLSNLDLEIKRGDTTGEVLFETLLASI